MNERILKLFTQACYHGDYEPENVPNEVVEKFAELIVRECVEVCLEQRNPANLNYKPSEQFAEAVKQHFGVE